MRRLILAILASLAMPIAVCAQPDSVVRLEIFPADRTLHGPTTTQQLAVIAHFKNGTQRDVTQLTQFSSTDNEIATVSAKGVVRFLQQGEIAVLCRYQLLATVQLRHVAPKPGFLWTKPPENNLVDHLIFAKLKEMSLLPSDLCSDAVFVRRAYLDVCGLLPTPTEAKRFLDDQRAHKRTRLIDELLDRPEYAELWAYHWCESLALHSQSHDPLKSSTYLYWLRGEVRKNTPLDQLARHILVGKEFVTQAGPVSFYTGGQDAPELASRAARAFLGIRLDCMQCHPHLRARWTQDDYRGMLAFFSQVKRGQMQVGRRIDVVTLDPLREWLHPHTRKPIAPRFLDGATPALKPGQDRRIAFADWLAAPNNPFFARTMVNRIWAHLMGKGLADPPEMLHELPITANDALLDVLARELLAQRGDGKQIIRIIMNTRTYQLSSATNAFNKDDDKYFSHVPRRHLTAPVVQDVQAQLLEVPLEFKDMPRGTRAVHMLATPWSLDTFSRPQRFADCEADSAYYAPVSTLHLLHNEPMLKMLRQPDNRIGRLFAEKRSDRAMLEEIFQAAWARVPVEKEYKAMAEHIAKSRDRRAAWEDLMFAVINSTELVRRP